MFFFLIFSSGSIQNATYTVKGNIQRAQVSTANVSPPPPPPPPPPPAIAPIQVNPQSAAAPPLPPPAIQVNLQVPAPPPLAIQVNPQLAAPPSLAIQVNLQAPAPADDGNVENVLDVAYR